MPHYYDLWTIFWAYRRYLFFILKWFWNFMLCPRTTGPMWQRRTQACIRVLNSVHKCLVLKDKIMVDNMTCLITFYWPPFFLPHWRKKAEKKIKKFKFQPVRITWWYQIKQKKLELSCANLSSAQVSCQLAEIAYWASCGSWKLVWVGVEALNLMAQGGGGVDEMQNKAKVSFRCSRITNKWSRL